MVRFANVVGVVDGVLFVVAGLLETSFAGLGELIVVSGNEGDCAVERVGEKKGWRERKKKKREQKRFMASEKREGVKSKTRLSRCQQPPGRGALTPIPASVPLSIILDLRVPESRPP